MSDPDARRFESIAFEPVTLSQFEQERLRAAEECRRILTSAKRDGSVTLADAGVGLSNGEGTCFPSLRELARIGELKIIGRYDRVSHGEGWTPRPNKENIRVAGEDLGLWLRDRCNDERKRNSDLGRWAIACITPGR